jgi:hypothetical protein
MAALVIAIFLTSASVAEAQVGLASRESRVTLIAHIGSGAAMPVVGSPRVLAVRGSVLELAVTVRLSSKGGYRLLVHGTAGQRQPSPQISPRIWVQGIDGNFHELREGTAVTVAHDERPAGELDREVRYRLEHSNTSSETATLPVRYEIAVKPVI